MSQSYRKEGLSFSIGGTPFYSVLRNCCQVDVRDEYLVIKNWTGETASLSRVFWAVIRGEQSADHQWKTIKQQWGIQTTPLSQALGGNYREGKQTAFLQRGEMWCFLRSPILSHSLVSDMQLQTSSHNKVGHNISKASWIGKRITGTDLISGIVMKEVMISGHKSCSNPCYSNAKVIGSFLSPNMRQMLIINWENNYLKSSDKSKQAAS